MKVKVKASGHKPLTEREKAKFLLFCENETLAEWAYEVEE